MTTVTLAESAILRFEGEVTSDSEAGEQFDWALSEDACRLIEAIEANMRSAEQRSGTIIVG